MVEGSLARAWAAGCRVLAVTIDTNAPGYRERDIRNGSAQLIGGGILAKLPFVPHLLRHPRWLAGYLSDRKEVMFYPNVVQPGVGPMRARDVRGNLLTSAVAWEDLPWIRALWPGQIVMKGVITGDDARRAIDEGAVGVIVSQPWWAAARHLLPDRARAAGSAARGERPRRRAVDGGIRRGADIAKALAMGAKAVLVGRAYAYGLAGAGEAGRGARDRHPARRSRTHARAARLPLGPSARPVLRGRSEGLVNRLGILRLLPGVER